MGGHLELKLNSIHHTPSFSTDLATPALLQGKDRTQDSGSIVGVYI